MDKVSIIMGIFNCSDTLADSIESIIGQKYGNWELIMCDDASTDSTTSIAKEYARRYREKIILIHNEENMGLSYSLNHCLKFASGMFIARMDGDDLSLPDRLEKQISYLKTNQDIQLVGCGMQEFSDKGLGMIRKNKQSPDKYDLRVGPCFCHATIMTYKYVYERLGGYTVSSRTRRTQDYDLWFRFFAAGFSGANLNDILYHARVDGNAYKKRNTKLYFWAVVTRLKGFRMLNFPFRYYPYILKPMLSLINASARRIMAGLRKAGDI